MADTSSPSVWSDLRGVAFEQGWLDAGGIRTRYISAGDPTRPLLLLLHGVGGHAEAYARNFGPHAEHFWTVAIDMIGHGWTDKPDVQYQLPDYVAHVLAVLEALGRDRALISGESLGGWVATWLAVHHPHVVEKMVLNTAGGWTAHPEVMARIRTLSNEAASDPTWERIRTRLEFLMCDHATVTDDLIETRRAIYAQPGFAASMARIMCLQEMELRRRNMVTEAQYRSIATPTLVVWTSHDPTATPAEGAEIAADRRTGAIPRATEDGRCPDRPDRGSRRGPGRSTRPNRVIRRGPPFHRRTCGVDARRRAQFGPTMVDRIDRVLARSRPLSGKSLAAETASRDRRRRLDA